MADKSNIEWKDATVIIDRGGRRIRAYRRKDASRPGQQLRRQMAAQGFKWCRRCRAWLPSVQVTKSGLCKPHENERYRQMYAHGGKAAIAQRVHSRKRDIGPIPARGQEILQEHFGGLCAYCSTRPATTWDHVIPISKGGKTHPGSIVPACMACNSSKKNTNLAAWLTSKQIPLNDNLIDILLLAEVLPYEHCDFN